MECVGRWCDWVFWAVFLRVIIQNVVDVENLSVNRKDEQGENACRLRRSIWRRLRATPLAWTEPTGEEGGVGGRAAGATPSRRQLRETQCAARGSLGLPKLTGEEGGFGGRAAGASPHQRTE